MVEAAALRGSIQHSCNLVSCIKLICVQRKYPRNPIRATSDLEFLVRTHIAMSQEWDLDNSLSRFLKEQA